MCRFLIQPNITTLLLKLPGITLKLFQCDRCFYKTLKTLMPCSVLLVAALLSKEIFVQK